MTLLDFFMGALVVFVVLCLPFALGFRFRHPRPATVVANELEVCLHMAFVHARKQRYPTISLEQLLLALLDEPSAASTLRACAIDIDAMRDSVAAIVRDSPPIAEGAAAVEPSASPEFQRVLQRAIARVMSLAGSAGHPRHSLQASSWVPARLRPPIRSRTVDGADVLVALLEEADGRAVEELRRHGVTRLAVVSAIAHGTTRPDPAAARPPQAGDAGTVAIVLQNDDFTPMEFVVEALQQHLDLDVETTVRVMLEVHRQGRAVAGRFPVEEAMAKAERLRAAATQAGHPFRCTVEAR